MEKFGSQLPSDLLKELRGEARVRDCKVQKLLTDAVRDYFDRQRNGKKGAK